MVWSQKSKADNKPRYIKKYGSFIVLTKDSAGAVDEIPSGYKIVELPSGHLKLTKTK